MEECGFICSLFVSFFGKSDRDNAAGERMSDRECVPVGIGWDCKVPCVVVVWIRAVKCDNMVAIANKKKMYCVYKKDVPILPSIEFYSNVKSVRT